jgi:hypothetical protein
VDQIEVLWPSGLLERFTSGAADRFVTLVEASGSAAAPGGDATKR